MSHIAYLHGLTNSDRSAPEPVLDIIIDIAIIDIGEEATIAMLDVSNYREPAAEAISSQRAAQVVDR